jgi:hypothetical protein
MGETLVVSELNFFSCHITDNRRRLKMSCFSCSVTERPDLTD